MKKLFFVACIVALLSCLTLSEAESEPIVLKGLTPWPSNNLNLDPVPMLIDKINKNAKGRLKIEWVGGPEVMKQFDQIHALKAGTIDMLLYYPSGYMASLMPEAWAHCLSELAEWEERKTGAFDLWCEIFAKRVNAQYLGRMHSLLRFMIYSNKKIQKVEDFRGMKMRVQPLYIPFMKALGAAPVTIKSSEIYTAMERGVVDGFMRPRFGMISWGLHEVTKYMIEPGLYQTDAATMVNLDKWKKIPKDLQNMVMEVMQDMEYIATMRGIMIEKKEDAVRAKAGMEIIQLPPQEAQKLVKICYNSTWDHLMEKAPEYTTKLRKLSTKEAIPKGTFPWQLAN
jgi:TRAP-type C4-dicarboxylate transport system substrate-binding protein